MSPVPAWAGGAGANTAAAATAHRPENPAATTMTTCRLHPLSGRPGRTRSALALALTAGLGCCGLASAADDEAALDLTSAPVEATPVKPSASRLFFEAAAGRSDGRNGAPSRRLSRASIDLLTSASFGGGWQAVLSDRLDHQSPAETGRDATLNSLREAYLGWSAEGGASGLAFGRINLRHGPAYGYNPTDFFRDGSLRTVSSVNPFAQRETRMGTFALRGQRLWSGGSVALTLSPKLADAPSGRDFDLDFGATNNRNRGLLTFNQQWGERLSTQWLLYKDANLDLQPGASATALLSNSVVAHGEWSQAREPSLADRAWGITGQPRSGQRLTLGATWTTPTKLSLTLERQHNGLALSGADWNAAAAISPALLGAYLLTAERRQDLAGRDAWMLFASQPDLLVKHLDLTFLLRLNDADHSRLTWLELRHHWTQVDLALQLQFNDGRALSQYGLYPERRIAQAVLTYHLR